LAASSGLHVVLFQHLLSFLFLYFATTNSPYMHYYTKHHAAGNVGAYIAYHLQLIEN